MDVNKIYKHDLTKEKLNNDYRLRGQFYNCIFY